MTTYKALISIVVIAVVVVATISWSPLVADARWVSQEGEVGKLPLSDTAAHVDFTSLNELRSTPANSAHNHRFFDIGNQTTNTETARSLTESGPVMEDEVSPTCRRVCVRWNNVPITVCDQAGNCTTKTVRVCCKWDLRDCYTG